MRMMTLGALVAAGLLAFAATPAAASCCDHMEKAPCCDKLMAGCCKAPNDPIAEAVLMPNLQDEARPSRETLVIFFQKPVKVGDRILQGKYVIEHDNNRMARGEPCTYIYAASDFRLPVVTFHCTHLERGRSGAPTVVLRSLGEANGMKELVAFQFAGETGAHGVPVNR
jgi:hypothetical protein